MEHLGWGEGSNIDFLQESWGRVEVDGREKHDG